MGHLDILRLLRMASRASIDTAIHCLFEASLFPSSTAVSRTSKQSFDWHVTGLHIGRGIDRHKMTQM